MQLAASALTLMAFAAPPIAPPAALPQPQQAQPQVAQTSQAEQICLDAVSSSGYRVDNILSTNTFSGGAEVIMEVRDRGESYAVGCDYSDNTGRIELYQLDDSGYNRNGDQYNDQYSDRYENCNSNRYGDCHDENDDRYDDRYDDRHDNRYDSRYDGRDNDPYNDRYDDNWRDDPYGDRHDNWQGDFSDSSSVRSEGDAEEIARGVVGDQLGIRDPYSDVVRIDDVHRESGERNWIVEGRANGAPFVVKIRSSDASVLDFELH